ncbi:MULTISPECIES: efflux RND transporter periplasmic adaptor subunit [Legionella]|uniref:efflux RND transporter periplasmic adaptor subunit n=1 Tax=Legionella TaxID=445 RepID=UPI000F8F36A7|nr:MULTISPECIES: efflux RND transporter periplasmic adaptor subunit [Legionella]MCP0912976.1 efflux RND transporter periplasmic adaptor subunit [Legionella sp. 27cVA30]RUQ96878.1 efflux RND transporter periplasmic adaptor subunit [Legionella septentrionalis]RUR10944.1 efflux RND transporter periplasmic adaptor subunit [Legionella septentrionalis]RUR15384.1 efflux RND transporter periplasmic adaptor subunit [Legionella septentrionalis]
MNFNKKLTLKTTAVIGVIVLLAIYFMLHPRNKNIAPTPPTAVVVVKKPQWLKRTEYITQTGNTVAFNSVNLVARVEGYLEEVKFVDGAAVKKGQELFIIEQEPYKQKLEEAQASVAAQKAAYAYAKAEYERQRQMYKENATSLKNVEKWEAKSEESKAEVAKAEANAEVAAINYSYTRITAPFDGRIGRHLIDPGNLVGHGETTNLAVIEQIDPIYVYFNLNELDLIKLREAAKAHGFKPAEITKIPVYVGMQNEANFPHQGKLDFVNTGLNSSTGTIEFRALLTNKNYPLLPGLFVQVRIPITKPMPQLTIPDTAIQYDQIGPYVLTVNQNHEVIMKRVVLGNLDQGVRAISKGLNAEDNVIVDGIQNAVPGYPVTPKTQAE